MELRHPIRGPNGELRVTINPFARVQAQFELRTELAIAGVEARLMVNWREGVIEWIFNIGNILMDN